MIQANEEKTKMYAPIYDEFGMEVGTVDVCPYFEVSKIIKKILDFIFILL